MGRYSRIRAAEQMERDGIRSLNRHEVGKCKHKGPESFGFVTGCKNAGRYHVKGVGVRCFTHAAPFIGRNDPALVGREQGEAARKFNREMGRGL